MARSEESLATHLHEVVGALTQALGAGFHVRHEYEFAVPNQDRLVPMRADVVLFSSRVASMESAEVGFLVKREADFDWLDQLTQFAYLGAPVLVVLTDDTIGVYAFRGSTVPVAVESWERKEAFRSEWVRDRVLGLTTTEEAALFPGADRQLLLGDARSVLRRSVEYVMRLLRTRASVEELAAFRLAIGLFRDVYLGEGDVEEDSSRDLLPILQEAREVISETISFANLPPESIAELYESLAIGVDTRKRHGVVYTPAWLARYAVERLPRDAFRPGARAVDPTCGSGTFLVCFLKRWLNENYRGSDDEVLVHLPAAVGGMDIDPVAIEATRLALDFFRLASDLPVVHWSLETGDATRARIACDWLIGNLPFGYRTGPGNRDVSSVIIEHVHTVNSDLKGFSLIFPDSIAYAKAAEQTRAMLQSSYRILEMTRLPETTFQTSHVQTLMISARRDGPTTEVLIRDVREGDVPEFQQGTYVSRSYVSRLPAQAGAQWYFSPFSNAFERAERQDLRVRDVADVHIGLQLYGYEGSPTVAGNSASSRPLLSDPGHFSVWDRESSLLLPHLIAERDDVRRAGPWEKFPEAKVIVRATTSVKSTTRLASISDTRGLWFTDKFVGVWPRRAWPSAPAIAAYFQTRFARTWFQVHNPSRKLRIATLLDMPVPRLADTWWERAAELVQDDTVVYPPRGKSEAHQDPLFRPAPHLKDEWAWLDRAVEAAFGISPTTGSEMDKWLASLPER